MQAVLSLAALVAGQQASIPTVSFADTPGVVYAALRETGKTIGVPVVWTPEAGTMVGNVPLDPGQARILADGTKVVPIRSFAVEGVTIVYNPATEEATLHTQGNTYLFVRGEKFVEVSIKEQTLRAWEGPFLVIETNVSTGRRGFATPTGKFSAKTRERMRFSRKYNNSPMPWSVQVNGDIFIHGYKSVPPYPASHGCVRMPMGGSNAARRFWEWVEVGTPVHILQEFTRRPEPTQA